MQSYPDPTVVNSESGGPFYSPGNNNHNTSQQQRLTNPDDLQLAAQLTRGLEPIMGSGADRSMHDASDNLNQEHVNQQYSQDAQLQLPAGMAQTPYQPGNDDMTPRKRSKASRACDECRRKKIKCDATDESGETQCSSCKRVGTRCQFSRVPMKRGPSKG
jgi:hypothetical protein